MTAHKFTFETYLERGSIELDVEVTYSVSPHRPVTLEQPAEGGEVEIISVKANGVEIPTSREEDNRLYDEACDRSEKDVDEWHAELEEYRADMARDERMMRDFQMGCR